ncbi:hypothetical protein ACQI4L_06325 [Mycolicibacterium litorale]
MAEVLDPNGAAWSVYRRWWPFPGVFDLTFDLAELAWEVAQGARSGRFVI